MKDHKKKVLLTRCKVIQIFEKDEYDGYEIKKGTLLQTKISELNSKVVDYSVVIELLKDFTFHKNQPIEQNENKLFHISGILKSLEDYNQHTLESITFEISKN